MDVRCPEVVGRTVETARLATLVRRAAANDGEVIVITGVAGIGKTALVGRLESLVEDAGGCALVGRASPGSAVPYRMLSEVALAAVARGADPAGHDLRLYRSALHRLVGDVWGGGEPDRSPPNDLVVAEALLRLVANVRRPVVTVLEDLHWADADTLRAFEFLCDHAPTHGIGLAATMRSDEPSDASALVGHLDTRRAVERLTLEALDRDAVQQMVALGLNTTPDPVLVDAILERSAGRPLIVEELLGAVATGATDLDAVDAVPATLLESVRRRLDRLSTAHRRVVVLAAAMGIDVDLGILSRLAEIEHDDVIDAMSAAERAHLAAVTADRARFGHALTRDAVIGAAGAAELRLVASRALELLGPPSTLDDDELETAAALAPRCSRPDGTARLQYEAGKRALERGALRSAHRWLTSAREAAADDYDLRAELGATLVECLSHSGRVADALREGEDALRMAGIRSDVEAERRIQLALVRTDVAAERWDHALGRLDALDEASIDRPDAVVLRALAELGAGRPERAAAAAHAIVDGGRVPAAPAVRCEALEVLGRVSRASDLDAAAQWFERAARTAERAGLKAWRAGALHELATIRQLDSAEVGPLRAALDAAMEAGALGLATSVLFHVAALHGVRFESEPALAAGRQGLDLARRLGTARQQAMAWITIGQAHAVDGREVQARAAASEAIALAPDDLEVAALAGGACIGLVLVLNERGAEALEEISTAVATLERLPAKTPVSTWYLWPLLCAAHGAGGARALEVTDVTELRTARGFDALWLLAAAVEAGRHGRTTEARSLAERSVAQFDRTPGFRGYRHVGLRLAGEAALEAGWGDPAPWLTEAADWFEQQQLKRPAQACRSLASRAGVPRRRTRGEPVPAGLASWGVTSREVDVLGLLGEGLTNREIAERLYIAPRTVKSHVEHLLTKTQSANRAQLAVLAAQHLPGEPGAG